LIVARYFAAEQAAIAKLEAELEAVGAELTELEEENGGEEGAFGDLDKINKANVAAKLKEIKGNRDAEDDIKVLEAWLALNTNEARLKATLRELEATLDEMAGAKSRRWWSRTSGWRRSIRTSTARWTASARR
jgi:type I restriction enzyme M protein